jgi:ketosteroid isomerase-like protein
MIEINIPDVVAEVTAAWERYNRAVNANDVAVMNELFWDSALTVRYGAGENLYGHGEIAQFRGTRKGPIDRAIGRVVITTFGRDFATAFCETQIAGSTRRGRQSHTWVRTDQGWRIVAAHVSSMEGA